MFSGSKGNGPTTIKNAVIPKDIGSRYIKRGLFNFMIFMDFAPIVILPIALLH
jgi:hypothetical protein